MKPHLLALPFLPLLHAAQTPAAYQFTLSSFSGSGCPDHSLAPSPGYSTTRQSYGPFMMNSSSTTFWEYIALPYMHTSLSSNDSSRLSRVTCDLVVQYDEVNEYGIRIPMEQRTHQLRLHKNGSLVEGNYEVQEGVVVEWQVRLQDFETRTVMAQDYAQIEGPYSAGNSTHMDFQWMPPLFTPEQWVQPECGTATFRMRVDLWLAARKAGVGGKVDSKVVNYGDGMGPRRSGINVGYSFDWEQC